MVPVPDEALHRILQQIQTQLITSSRQLSMVKAQLQGHETGKRRIELTAHQIEQESKDAQRPPRFWQGVGKMFVIETKENVQAQLADRQKDLEQEIANLSKKQKFLEKQVAESQSHMRDLFAGLEKQQTQNA